MKSAFQILEMGSALRRELLHVVMSAACIVYTPPRAAGQADAPPERESAVAPGQLPKLDVPSPETKGKLALQLAGNSAFTEKELRTAIARQIVTIEDYGLDAANAYDAGFFLENHYRKHGYSQVTAESRITGRWSLRMRISDGPKTTIGKVSVPGAKSHTTKEVTDYLLGPTRERFPRLKNDAELPFVEGDLQAGADLVRRLYLSDGFLDATVEAPQISLSRNRTVAAVTLRIQEGVQYSFGNITFAGNPIFPRTELAKAIDEEIQKSFTPGRLEAAQRKLEDFYKKRGYFVVKLETRGARENARGGRVPVVFVITPGPKHHFSGVNVRGTENVRPQFIQNRLLDLRDKTYDPELVDEKFRALIQTGLFRNLRINPQRADVDEVLLDVEIEEAKPKEFGIGLGFASYEGFIASLNYTDRNFLSTARPLSFGIEYTARGYKGELAWNDPWLFETDNRLRARLYAVIRDEVGYSKNEFGFHTSLSRNITKNWEVSAFVLAKKVSISKSTIVPRRLLGQEDYIANSIGVSSTLDYRNNPANPTKGFLGTVTFDAANGALGSDVEFLRGTLKLSVLPAGHHKYGTLLRGARRGDLSDGKNFDRHASHRRKILLRRRNIGEEFQ